MAEIIERTFDSPDDVVEHEREYPKCDICGAEIKSKYYYFIDDECMCLECMNEAFRMKTEDYPQF
jgi:hypothetical protein